MLNTSSLLCLIVLLLSPTHILLHYFFLPPLAHQQIVVHADARTHQGVTSNRDGIYGMHQRFGGGNSGGLGRILPWSTWIHPFLSGSDSLWSTIIPGFNIKEYDDEYIAFVECPGYKRKEIKISLENDRRLKIEAKKECKEKDRFCVPGSLLEEFEISPAVNVDKISVYLEDGILHLHLPKLNTHSSKFFNIQLPSIFGGHRSDPGDRIPVSQNEHHGRHERHESNPPMSDYVSDYYNDAKHFATEGMTKMYESQEDNLKDAKAYVDERTGQLTEQAKEREKQGQEAAGKMYDAVKDKVNKASENVKDTLKNNAAGVKEGAKEASERIKEDLKETAHDTVQGMKQGYDYGYGGYEAPSSAYHKDRERREQEEREADNREDTFTGKVKRGFESIKEKVTGKTEF